MFNTFIIQCSKLHFSFPPTLHTSLGRRLRFITLQSTVPLVYTRVYIPSNEQEKRLNITLFFSHTTHWLQLSVINLLSCLSFLDFFDVFFDFFLLAFFLCFLSCFKLFDFFVTFTGGDSSIPGDTHQLGTLLLLTRFTWFFITAGITITAAAWIRIITTAIRGMSPLVAVPSLLTTTSVEMMQLLSAQPCRPCPAYRSIWYRLWCLVLWHCNVGYIIRLWYCYYCGRQWQIRRVKQSLWMQINLIISRYPIPSITYSSQPYCYWRYSVSVKMRMYDQNFSWSIVKVSYELLRCSYA